MPTDTQHEPGEKVNPPPKVQLVVEREGCYVNGGHQVLIQTTHENGRGHGDRLLGPKLCALGKQEHLAQVDLDQMDARSIFLHIRPLLGDEWLAEQVTR